ncbi:BadF/BadG/BcrA/BcrD ATPase family protein [Dickeya fangzhongdai]|uniref:BadF/BadG/BcrA/BcrD ATPase family protein n=1 Tax=Dickeya fangzhongdai TaxID=1778540 RepID=UPI0004F8ECDE|nr:BadF/BadG/BcrA/BcrD ATPase family protein [Dickeya fangzhongdai]AIR69446.1 N-acetylglucosamine kinase [Dickeya fangzhongdai]KGU00280.1 N-acetylglucosamine kinase [Dickeya fangzhongdai]
MQVQYLLGIDGGGTHCRARLTNLQGNVLAECQAGPANVYSDYSQALQTASLLAHDAVQRAGLPADALQRTIAVSGLAGANVPSLRQRLQQWRPPFYRHQTLSDAEIACIGAHQGEPGAILIVGTGSQGVIWDGQAFHSVGGWGFALADQGSGAQLGRRALRHALLAHDELVENTALIQAIMARFEHNPEHLLQWSGNATPADWAAFAPLVFQAAEQQDPAASMLLQRTADDITLLLSALIKRGQGRVSLMGGLAAPVLPWLPHHVQATVVPAQTDALSGALYLARRQHQQSTAGY